jgi:hypothetical protein
MRDAVERAACSSCLGTALGLAAPAASVRLALLRVASSRLDAALGLASLAASMCDAVPRVLRVLRLQHNSVSVNMFGPLLRLPAFFCLFPVLFPHLPG